MSSPSSRRNFLRGRVATHRAEPHPPWALAEREFIAACTRCGDCARACPTRIIRQGDGGYPTVDFANGECTFCGECVAHCPTGALLRQGNQPPWQLRAEIGERCIARQQVECRICGEMCEFAAIRFVPQPGGIATPLLDGERCTGCGACVAPCPTTAITVR
ncbi:MAG: ferredoxin-type protein NapF [Rhodocyclales bacterium]|nr:ferredoxin-type protein NapF [Rhodocyclales bacterium]